MFVWLMLISVFDTVDKSVSAVIPAFGILFLLTIELLPLWLLFELLALRLVVAWTRFALELALEHMLLDWWVSERFWLDYVCSRFWASIGFVED